jgi:hypothetical protein
MQLMHGLDELEAQGQMTWIEAQHGWAAAPGDVVDALSRDGFEECKRETTTSRQKNLQPAGVACGRVSTRARDPAASSVIRTRTTAAKAD